VTWSGWLHRHTVGRLLAVRPWARPGLSPSIPILGRPLAIRPGLDRGSCQPFPATTALLVHPGFDRALRLWITGGLFTLMYVQISYCVIRTYVSANRLPVIRTYVSANIISHALYPHNQLYFFLFCHETDIGGHSDVKCKKKLTNIQANN